MKLPKPIISNSLKRKHQNYSCRKLSKPTTGTGKIVPSVIIREDVLTGRGWNCAPAGGGHVGYSCYSAVGYPHLSIVGATRTYVAGLTFGTGYYNLDFDRFHYSPNAYTSYWYEEFSPGKWDPSGNNSPDIADTAANYLIGVLGGFFYGYGARNLAALGNVVYV